MHNFSTLVFAICLLFLQGCNYLQQQAGQVSDTAGTAEQDSVVISANQRPIYVTNIDQLRMRRYPDTKSKILTTFDENALLYYLGEQTDYQERIGKYKGHWLRVQSIDKVNTGWVYGAEHFVVPLLTEQRLDSLSRAGKGVAPFQNLARKDMTEMTGMNWSGSVPGTRYSGYYTYDLTSRPDLIDGRMIIRTKTIDRSSHQVQYIPCYVDFQQGMASTDVICSSSVEKAKN